MVLEKKLSVPKKWEYIIPIFATLSLIISCVIVSHKKFFWLDELFSFYLLSDPNFSHMMAALSDKINSAPPLYFILGWLWAKLFNSTELSLRLFSSLGICAAFVTVWITLRRIYNFWSASIGTLAAFCLSSVILEQNAETRFYGLFIAVCALGLLQYEIINRQEKCSFAVLLFNTSIHGAIILTHIFGFLYSGAILFSLVIRDRYFSFFRPSVYLSIVLGWLLFIPWINSFQNQADAGKPHSWIPIPNLIELINSFSFSQALAVLLVILLGISYLLFSNEAQFEKIVNAQQKSLAETSFLILAYSVLAVPVVAWIISRTLESIFVSRYMIPITISWSILLTYLSSRIFPSVVASKIYGSSSSKRLIVKQKISLIMLMVFLVTYPILYAKSYGTQQLPGLKDDSYGYTELPIAVESPHVYLPRFYYSPKPNRYFFILDWQAALDKGNLLNSTVDYKVMEALKQNYPAQNIVQGKDFLDRYNRFLVLDEDGRRWFEMRIKNNHKYTFRYVDKVDGINLLLVDEII